MSGIDESIKEREQNTRRQPECQDCEAKRIIMTYLWQVLTQIAGYMDPDQIREDQEKNQPGLDPEEYLEMVYENVLEEARTALRKVEKP